jgi:hypothetical protein
MKSLFFTIAGIMLLISPVAQAQLGSGSASVKLNSATLKGNALNLDMDIKIAQMNIGRYESVSLRLVLRGTGKGQTLPLPPVIINGANKRQMYERTLALHGATVAKNGAYAVLKNDPELIQYLSYKRAVTYNSWMNNCQLLLVVELKDYRNNTIQSSTRVVSRRLSVRRSTTIPTSSQPSANPSGRANATTRQPAANPNTRQNNTAPANRARTTANPANRQQNTAPASNRPRTATGNSATPPANRQNDTRRR